MSADTATETATVKVLDAGAAPLRLQFAGALTVGNVHAVWQQLPRALQRGAKAQQLDVQAVQRIDSAGLALLHTLAGADVQVIGAPEGLAELSAAYRMDAQLAWQQG